MLLIEDNRADALLLQRELRVLRPDAVVHVASDGDVALSMLRGTDGTHRVEPGLVLLDLKLPKRSGREILRELKDDPGLRQIPVVVLTSSTLAGDIDGCYEGHVNAYVPKPVGLTELRHTLRAITSFWLEVAFLPGAAP